jgi:FkbM family methyltransferase
MSNFKRHLRRTLTAAHLDALYGLWHRAARWDPRRLRRQALFRAWNRGAAADEIVLRPGLRLRIDELSREPFEHFCFRSPDMARELDVFVRAMPAHRSFLDVGALHGIFSLVFASGRSGVRALAVEPSGIAHSILVDNLHRNRLANVIPRQIACGAGSGRLRMRQVWHHLEALPPEAAAPSAEAAADGALEGSAAPTSLQPSRLLQAPAVQIVAMTSVDALCAELDFQPDLIKIDVEGYELAVLAGARAILARCRPRLFLEVHPRGLQALGGSVEAVVALLAELGYGFFSLRGAPLDGRRIGASESVGRFVCST